MDDRDQVTGPQDISGEVAAGRCGLGFRHRLLTREQNGLFGRLPISWSDVRVGGSYQGGMYRPVAVQQPRTLPVER